MKKGFTLIEMLVVVGIIAILMGASIAGFSKMTKTAEKAKCQELVRNTATAMAAIFNRDGFWPTPWATAYIKSHGTGASLSSKIGEYTIKDHILHFALDLDGDGIIEGANVGGESIDVRATAIVWCCGKDGKLEAYSAGLRKDDVYSFTFGQTQNVK